MPSPIGHVLAGLATAWTADRRRPGEQPEAGTTSTSTMSAISTVSAISTISQGRLAIVCAVLAALPDADLLYGPFHRTATHSLVSIAIVFSIAAVVTGRVTAQGSRGSRGSRGSQGSQGSRGSRGSQGSRGSRGSRHPMWIAGICAAAWGTHVLMDWLGADNNPPYGIQLLWPFSREWFMAPWTIFPGTERRDPFSARAIAINARAALAEVGLMGSVALLAWWTRRRNPR